MTHQTEADRHLAYVRACDDASPRLVLLAMTCDTRRHRTFSPRDVARVACVDVVLPALHMLRAHGLVRVTPSGAWAVTAQGHARARAWRDELTC